MSIFFIFFNFFLSFFLSSCIHSRLCPSAAESRRQAESTNVLCPLLSLAMLLLVVAQCRLVNGFSIFQLMTRRQLSAIICFSTLHPYQILIMNPVVVGITGKMADYFGLIQIFIMVLFCGRCMKKTALASLRMSSNKVLPTVFDCVVEYSVVHYFPADLARI